MVDISTNVMISSQPYFSEFSCLKAQLIVEETQAWRERHKFDQPMVPSGNMLFFVSETNIPLFVEKKSIEKVTLNSNLQNDCRILTFLVHQSLKMKLKKEELFQWHNFYTDKNSISIVRGRTGNQYDIFKGFVPKVFFQNGHCIIAFEPLSKVFSRLNISAGTNQFNDAIGFCVCNNCGETGVCESFRFQVGRVLKVQSGRVSMIDIEGKRFDCPTSSVFVETRVKPTSGEYSNIIRQTAVSTKEEHDFVYNFVNSFSLERLKLNLGFEAAFSWLTLR